MSDAGKAASAYAVVLYTYWRLIGAFDLWPSTEAHVWIFGTLLLLGALAGVVYAAAKMRS
jgi:hypothetical protein